MEFPLNQRKPGQDRAPEAGKPAVRKGAAKEPGWAEGLKRLYDSVVEEPLPDSFEDLLKKLDD